MNEHMHDDHDLDLIAALVEGALEDPEEAEAQVGSCPDCAEVFEAHRIVLAALVDQGLTPLDDLERHRLRNSVWDALTAERTPIPQATSRSSTPWWYRVASAAAALVVVVGVGTYLLPGGEDASGTFDTVGAPVDRFEDTLEAPQSASDGATEESAMSDSAMAGEGFSATTSAETLTAVRQVDGDGLAEAVDDFQMRALDITAAVPEPALACVDDDTQAVGSVVATEEVVVDGAPAWFVAFGSSQKITTVNVYSQDCGVLYRGE